MADKGPTDIVAEATYIDMGAIFCLLWSLVAFLREKQLWTQANQRQTFTTTFAHDDFRAPLLNTHSADQSNKSLFTSPPEDKTNFLDMEETPEKTLRSDKTSRTASQQFQQSASQQF